jgi:hypothetical protein
VGARGIEQHEREAPITGNESELGWRLAQFGGTPPPGANSVKYSKHAS